MCLSKGDCYRVNQKPSATTVLPFYPHPLIVSCFQAHFGCKASPLPISECIRLEILIIWYQSHSENGIHLYYPPFSYVHLLQKKKEFSYLCATNLLDHLESVCSCFSFFKEQDSRTNLLEEYDVILD